MRGIEASAIASDHHGVVWPALLIVVTIVLMFGVILADTRGFRRRLTEHPGEDPERAIEHEPITHLTVFASTAGSLVLLAGVAWLLVELTRIGV